MDRRSFLKMFFSFLLFPFLPKAKKVEGTAFTADEYFLPRQYLENDEKKEPEKPDYVLGVDPGQGDDYTAWMRYPPLEWTIDPVEALIEPYPDLIETLEKIRRICCDPDLWKKPIEHTVIMSPGDYKWCSAQLEGVTWTPEGYFDIRTSPVRRSRGRPFPTIASLPKELTDAADV